MKFSTKVGNAESLRTGCLVVGAFDDGTLSSTAMQIDHAAGGALSALVKSGDLPGKAGDVTVLHKLTGVTAERVAIVGLGKADKRTDAGYKSAVAAVARKLGSTGASSVVLALDGAAPEGRDAQWQARQAVITFHDAHYVFDAFKSSAPKASALKEVAVIADRAHLIAVETGVREGDAIGQGVSLTRELGDLPANVCTPGHLADTAKKLAAAHKLKVEVLGRKEMQALGMNTLLSVAAGADEPPKFIVIKYQRGQPKAKPIVLVGKGVTFDTGGISLKPAPEMDEMKFDMCGAASVLGAIKTAALLDLPLNIVGLIPATENMPGGNATRPGDIVKSMSGQTVEILNTDAEGRLILCDALTYAERFDPDCVVDIATLTGACVIALGHVTSGLLANDQALAQELLDAGDTSADRAWQMPLWDEYGEQLKSNFADMANIGGRPAGTITAAAFLARFTTKFRWAHLDVAGTASRSGKEKGATGRPVPLLTQFLLGRAAATSRPATRRAR